jgi:alpha-amylase
MPLTLVLVFHSHQPYGNFPDVLEQATERAYRPLLASLRRHPHVRLGLHYSGTLLDWLEARHPALLDDLAALVTRGQVELLTGGYHEPILPIVPEADRIGQIQRLTRRLEGRFGVTPAGLWLTERIWEPGLPASLAHAGVRYTLLDDTPFQLAGVSGDALLCPYVTEDLGHTVGLLASLKELRYRIPWSPVDEVIAWLRERADRLPAALAVMGDDGEKLGLWPGTFAHVWRHEWWERFCTTLELEGRWLRTATPAEALAAIPVAGRVYLPAASYDELGEWALPAQAAGALKAARAAAEERDDGSRTLLSGGTWRGFLAKYPESNTLHKKMVWVSRKVGRMAEGPARDAAREALWAGQSNCPYWHGVFGGLYLLHLRTANWAALLTAEALADRATHGQDAWMAVSQTDWDADGLSETVVETAHHGLVLAPHRGGGLLVWDWVEPKANVLFALTRRREAYHLEIEAAAREGRLVLAEPEPATPAVDPQPEAQPTDPAEAAPGRPAGVPSPSGGADDTAAPPESIHTASVRVKEPGLEDRLFVDACPRLGLMDRWLPAKATLDDLVRGLAADDAGLLEAGWSLAPVAAPRHGGPVVVRLTWAPAETTVLAAATKELSIAADRPRLHVDYRLTAPAGAELCGRLAVETSWGLAGGDSPAAGVSCRGRRLALTSTGRWRDVKEFQMAVPAAGVHLRGRLEPAAELWQYPIEAVASSDGGYERSYQGTALVVVWTVQAAGAPWHGRLVLEQMAFR